MVVPSSSSSSRLFLVELYTKNPCKLIRAIYSPASDLQGQSFPFVGRGGSASVKPAALFDEIQYTNGNDKPMGGLVIAQHRNF